MTKVRWVLVLCCFVGLSECLLAATLHVDDFEDGTVLGWSGDAPMNIQSGGPGGVDDNYLQIIASGGGGRGSRPASYNQVPDWTGDIGALGATAIEFDMVNFDTSAADLNMRVVLFGPNSTSNRWTSTDAQVIPSDNVWRRYSFPIGMDDLTSVQGGATYDQTIADVVRVMLRHDTGTPSSRGSSLQATLGIDNIALVGGVASLPCDLDGDGVCGVADIDLLMNAMDTDQSQFDLNSDGVVNDMDRDKWLADAGSENGLAGPYLVGDANLDGSANAQDLNALALAWQTDNANWSNGNFTGKGTNAGDLNALALNWQASVSQAAAVPEPSSCGLTFLASCLLFSRFRSLR